MTTPISTLQFYPKQSAFKRTFALWYFTILILVWTIAGNAVLGFEQAYAHPVAAVAAAILVSLLLERVDSWSTGRRARYAGGWATLVNFLPPSIIAGLACAMLIYPNARLAPIVFAAGLSIASKRLFRAPLGNGQTQHIFNPSNFGISATLLFLPSVGLAPPYQFTENVTGIWYWVIPGLILATGLFVHGRFTGRLPLVLAWWTGFAAQGILRSWLFGIPVIVPFVPVTSAAFILFSLYMIPDPATTPIRRSHQIWFGFSVAAIYGALLVNHVVYGLFFALLATSATRGALLWLGELARRAEALNFRKLEGMAAATR